MKIEIISNNFEVTEDGIIKNYSLLDLKQKLINDMYKLENYEKEDVEILKILFEIKKD